VYRPSRKASPAYLRLWRDRSRPFALWLYLWSCHLLTRAKQSPSYTIYFQISSTPLNL
jgi:hypothetical protein